jgi:acetyl-CoA acetyltransferase
MRPLNSNCPSLRALRRLERATPEEVEEAVEAVFAAQRRRQVIRMYALVTHSGLRAVEVAHRCGKGPSAVSMAVRRIKELASQDDALANGLERLSSVLAETEDANAGPSL